MRKWKESEKKKCTDIHCETIECIRPERMSEQERGEMWRKGERTQWQKAMKSRFQDL